MKSTFVGSHAKSDAFCFKIFLAKKRPPSKDLAPAKKFHPQ
jgi:hypothetical protein